MGERRPNNVSVKIAEWMWKITIKKLHQPKLNNPLEDHFHLISLNYFSLEFLFILLCIRGFPSRSLSLTLFSKPKQPPSRSTPVTYNPGDALFEYDRRAVRGL